MKKDRTCCCLSTTSSASRKQMQRCLRCWAAFRRLWVTSRRSPQMSVGFKSVLQPPRRDRSRRCRRSTCQLTILRILLPLPRSRILTPPPCYRVRLPSWGSTPRWIRSIRRVVCCRRSSLEMSITMWLVACRWCCRTTRTCRISSPFWVWMSFRRTTSSLWLALVRSNVSCRSRSTWQRCLQATRAVSWNSKTPLLVSTVSSRASTTTCRRSRSSWLAQSTKPSTMRASSRPKWKTPHKGCNVQTPFHLSTFFFLSLSLPSFTPYLSIFFFCLVPSLSIVSHIIGPPSL
mmetsp:Transcript_14832/g.31810  ORF Transcript_14832/g.31810 Transcript_14832/m.31810 type:complete len:289 (+) Transcript_14832:284-1150(+)